ncbi:MAG: xanthine dehydrogenase family protein molybdopterin-binding subunit, partial [Proteobacteria bacterium]|nr:xanthine dehydrogenase family protein molybdopterin-binding subunit [Pseudomonadota bacterium]
MGVTRRQFLEATGTFAVAVLATPLGYRVVSAREAKAEAFRPNVWVAVTPDDRVIATVNKCEMGQGVFTSLPMILADELGADWKQVRIWKVPAGQQYIDPVWGMQATGGSTSVRHMFEPLRLASAAAREILIQAAAEEWGVLPSECEAHAGLVVHGASGRSLRFGHLVDRAAGLAVPEKPSLKPESEFTLIGKPVQRLDLPKKVQGKADFGIDTHVEGMLYAAVALPPAYGSKADSFDEKAALAVPGVRKVVPLGRGVGVCAEGIYAAWRGRDKLGVQWSGGTRPDLDTAAVEKVLRDELSKEGVQAKKVGDPDQALDAAAKVVEGTYVLPYLAHTTMEPMNCTVDVRRDRC